MTTPRDYSGVAVVAPTTVRYARTSDRPAHWWIGMALRDLLREDFGAIALAQRANARANPNALLGAKPLSLAAYLAAPPIVEPLHLFDCVMPCAGAEAFLAMEESRARALGLPHAVIRGAIERHNAYYEDPVAMQLEDLGFCGKGEAPALLRNRRLTVAGDLPVNTCGGQLSCGQAGTAGGFLPVVEALRQITGQPLGQAVPDARIALASGYGMVTYDRCLATGAAMLEGRP